MDLSIIGKSIFIIISGAILYKQIGGIKFMFEKLLNNPDVSFILNLLNSNNDTGYIVGGAIRDVLLGLEPHDIDFATNKSYDELKKLFSDYPCIETGKSFGVIRVKINNNEYEIAKYRKDINDTSVAFVNNIKDDLSRRDFTINAFALNKNNFMDLFNGKSDLENKIIRFVGNPDIRIKEDPLRILRALRFAGKPGFKIHPDTLFSMSKNKDLLKLIAHERIKNEFIKIIESPENIKVLEIMKETAILDIIIPEITVEYEYDQNNPYHKFDLWHHTLNVINACKDTDYITKLAALFHDIGKPDTMTVDEITGFHHFYGHADVSEDITKKILNRLKFSNQEIYDILALVKNHITLLIDSSDKVIRTMVHKIGGENTIRLANLTYADDEAKSLTNRHNDLYDNVIRVIKEFDIPKVSDLALNGYDLMKLGYTGKEIGEIKNYLLDKILDEGIPNDKENLLNIVHELKKIQA